MNKGYRTHMIVKTIVTYTDLEKTVVIYSHKDDKRRASLLRGMWWDKKASTTR